MDCWPQNQNLYLFLQQIHTITRDEKPDEPSTVLYLSMGPSGRMNENYLRRARHAFILGITPPDHSSSCDLEVDIVDRADFDALTPLGTVSKNDALGKFRLKNGQNVGKFGLKVAN